MSQLRSTSFTWVIDNFVTVDHVIHCSNSEIEHGLILLIFRPNEEENQNSNIDVNLFSGRVDNDNEQQSDQKVLWTISLINDKGEECYSKAFDTNVIIPQERALIKCGSYCLDRDNIMNTANGLLPQGQLTVKCTLILMSFLEYHTNYVNLGKYMQARIANNTITLAQKCVRENYQSPLESSKFSDVVFVIGKKEFRLHKIILSAQSSVFAAMFYSDLEEAKQNRVEIPDVDVEVFEAMIRFIYSGNVDSVQQYALDLFVAADKYQLEHLKSVCEQSLISSLATESVCGVFLLSDMHSAKQLKDKCTKYMVENATKVCKTDGWKELVKSKRIDLVVELFEKLANKDAID